MNRVQKVLEGANIKLAAVASNVLGVVAFRLFDIFQGPRLLELMCISLLAGCGKTLLSTQGRKLSDDKRRPIACSERIIRIGLSHAECRRDS